MAARARVRALEAQVALLCAEDERARRGALAIASSSEAAALKAERDAMALALSAAEKKTIVAERQQQNERERRESLSRQLKRKESALQRAEAEKSSLLLREMREAEAQLGGGGAKAQAEEAIGSPLHVGLRVLIHSMREMEEESEGRMMRQREACEDALSEALERAVKAERQLAQELVVSERTVVGEAHERAESEAASWQREAVMLAKLQALQQAREEESKRAARVEVELAAAREALLVAERERAASEEAWQSNLEARAGEFREESEQQRARGSEIIGELEATLSRARQEAQRLEAELFKANAAIACGAHAWLMLRVGVMGLMRQRLLASLRLWEATAALLSADEAAETWKEEVRSLKLEVQGKLASLREQRSRAEESSLAEAKRTEEEQMRKLQLNARKLQTMEERRRCLEREISILNERASSRAAAAECAAAPLRSAAFQEERRAGSELTLLRAEIKRGEIMLRRADAATHAARSDGRVAMLAGLVSALGTAACAHALLRWRVGATCIGLSLDLEATLVQSVRGALASRENGAREVQRVATAASQQAAALKLQSAARLGALRAEMAAAQVAATEAEKAAWTSAKALEENLFMATQGVATANVQIDQLTRELRACESARRVEADAAAAERSSTTHMLAVRDAAIMESNSSLSQLKVEMGEEREHLKAQFDRDRAALMEAIESVSSQRRSSLLGQSCLLIDVCSHSHRHLRLSRSLLRWHSVACFLRIGLESSAEIGLKADVKGKIALLKQRQIRANEAAARENAVVEEDTRKELIVLRKRFATEADRRAVLTGELRDCQQQRDAALKKEATTRTMLKRMQEAMRAECLEAAEAAEAAQTRALQAVAAKREIELQIEQLQRKLDSASLAQDTIKSQASEKLLAAEACNDKLREIEEQTKQERLATEEAAAIHSNSLEQAARRVTELEQELLEVRMLKDMERQRSETASRELSRFRLIAEQLEQSLAIAKQENADVSADLQAAKAQMRLIL
ncbi:MAG: hypothetical protein SGPRY_000235 [Prymnesium sp.]